MHVQLKQGVWWVQPLRRYRMLSFCKVQKWHLMQELMCFKAFLCQYIVSCIPLTFKEGGGYSSPSPSPKFATDVQMYIAILVYAYMYIIIAICM